MKTTVIIVSIITVLAIAIGCFIGGVIYADKTCNIPKDGNFEVDGYFTNIRKETLSIFDGDSTYFTKGTGASKEQAQDYKDHPEDYAEYVAALNVKNISNYDLDPVWAVLPGYQASSYNVINKQDNLDENRKVWLNCWLYEGGASLHVNETLRVDLHFIVKIKGMTDQEILDLLKNLQINLQMGICTESLNPQYDISRNISFNYPVYYYEENSK